MMYMDDAIRAILELMNAKIDNIKIRSSYNLSAISFTPKELYESIIKHYPSFKINYRPDFRQVIADSWPDSIDDSSAQNDWGWKPKFDLNALVKDMFKHL